MKVIFSGDRNWEDAKIILWLMTGLKENLLGVTCIEGEAPGADTVARVVAQHIHVPVDPTKAEWTKYGKAAGPIRNGKMITEKKGRMTMAFHDRIEESSGTLDMLRQTIANDLPAYLISHVNLERLREIEEWRNFKMTWWWIEGQRKRKNSEGKRIWIPLYSVPDEVHGKAVLRMILKDDPANHDNSPKLKGKEAGNIKARSKESKMLAKEYRDFRLVPPKDEPVKARAKRRLSENGSRTADKPKVQSAGTQVVGVSVVCPACKSSALKKVKKGEQKLYRCLGCNRRWAREGSVRPSKARKADSEGVTPDIRPRKRPKGRTKASK